MPSTDETSSSVSSYVESQLHAPMRVDISKATTNQTSRNNYALTAKTHVKSNINPPKTTKLSSALQMLARFDKKYKVKPVEPLVSVNNSTVSTKNVVHIGNGHAETLTATHVNPSNTEILISKQSIDDAKDNRLHPSVKVQTLEENRSSVDPKVRLPSEARSVPSTKDVTDVLYESDFELSNSDESIFKAFDSKVGSSSESVHNSLNKSKTFNIKNLSVSSGTTAVPCSPDKEIPNVFVKKNSQSQVESISSLESPSKIKPTGKVVENSKSNFEPVSELEDVISEEEPFKENIITFKDLLLKRAKASANSPEHKLTEGSSHVPYTGDQNLKPVLFTDKLAPVEWKMSGKSSDIEFLGTNSSDPLSQMSKTETKFEPNVVTSNSHVLRHISSHEDISDESEIEEEIEIFEENQPSKSHVSERISKHSLDSQNEDQSLKSPESFGITDTKADQCAGSNFNKKLKSMHEFSNSSRAEDKDKSSSVMEKSQSFVNENSSQKLIDLEEKVVNSVKEKSKSKLADITGAPVIAGPSLEDNSDVTDINKMQESINQDGPSNVARLEGSDKPLRRPTGSGNKKRERLKSILTETERVDCKRRQRTGNAMRQPQFTALKLSWCEHPPEEECFTFCDSGEIFRPCPEVVEGLTADRPAVVAACARMVAQQLHLTRRFMAAQYEAYLRCSKAVESFSLGYEPVTLEDTKQFIKNLRDSRAKVKVGRQH